MQAAVSRVFRTLELYVIPTWVFLLYTGTFPTRLFYNIPKMKCQVSIYSRGSVKDPIHGVSGVKWRVRVRILNILKTPTYYY